MAAYETNQGNKTVMETNIQINKDVTANFEFLKFQIDFLIVKKFFWHMSFSNLNVHAAFSERGQWKMHHGALWVFGVVVTALLGISIIFFSS